MTENDHAPRPTHTLTVEAYDAEPLPDYDVFEAVLDASTLTLDRLVPAAAGWDL